MLLLVRCVLLDRCDDRGRQPMGAGRGVLPQADPDLWRGGRGREAREDLNHGDHHPKRRR